MRRLLLAAVTMAALVACSLRAPRLTVSTCNTDKQCGQGQVCFAGECRSPAQALGSVVVEVTPPTSSPYASLQTSLDLMASAVGALDVPLPEKVQGGLVQDGDTDGGTPAMGSPVSGAQLQFLDAQAVIPGRAFTLSVQTDPSGGFAVQLPPSQYAVRVTPPAPLPPFETVLQAAAGDLKGVLLHLPSASSLAAVKGALKLGGQPLAGARVTPVDVRGVALGSPATTAADGRFALVLPPPPAQYLLRIGDAVDGAATSAGGPLPSYDDSTLGVRLSTAGSTDLGDLQLAALPAPATLQGQVLDSSGNPVGQAAVLASSEDGQGWVLSRSTTTGADGRFSLALREGRYLVEAAPAVDPAQPALSGLREVTVAAHGPSLAIACPPKTHGTGRVLRSDGKAVGPGATVIAARLPDRLVGSRAATTTVTDSGGFFDLTGDPGSYRVMVAPSPESGQPHQLAVIDVGGAADGQPIQLATVQLPPALIVVGTVRGHGASGAAPVANAAVVVFAVGGSGDGAVLLASTFTGADGRYRLILPDVSQPAVQQPASH